jgi:hypothetical protein
MARSPALVATGVTKGECGDATRRTVSRQMIGVVEVQLLQTKDHLLNTGTEIGAA